MCLRKALYTFSLKLYLICTEIICLNKAVQPQGPANEVLSLIRCPIPFP